jgi:hypothetical protein
MDKAQRNPTFQFDPRRIEVVDRVSAQIMSRMTGVRRIQLACQLGDSARHMVRAHLMQKHPDWSEEQLREEMIRRAGNGKPV